MPGHHAGNGLSRPYPPNLAGPEGLAQISPALRALGKGYGQIQSRRDGPRLYTLAAIAEVTEFGVGSSLLGLRVLITDSQHQTCWAKVERPHGPVFVQAFCHQYVESNGLPEDIFWVVFDPVLGQQAQEFGLE